MYVRLIMEKIYYIEYNYFFISMHIWLLRKESNMFALEGVKTRVQYTLPRVTGMERGEL